MRKTLLLQVAAALLLSASTAVAAFPERDDRPLPVPAHEGVAKALRPGRPGTTPRFSNMMLDPRYCNYEYVERQARMIVRSRLELTCTVRQ